MSQINVQESEISFNGRNSITGSSGPHNLTGSRARFQPVRIKALLSLFESEDDDTEPRDSDDNSDTESLQALPDDDDDDERNHVPSSSKDEPPPEDCASKTIEHENKNGIVIPDNVPINEKFVDNFETNKSKEIKQSEQEISGKSNSFDSKCSILPSSPKKLLPAPFKHVPNNTDNANSNNEAICTPQALLHQTRKQLYSQNYITSDMRFDPCQENLVDFDIRSKAKEPLCDMAMETPMKCGGVVTSNQSSCAAVKSSLETPQNKLNKEHSQSVIDTPGLIFSHWSRNNFFQTPTHCNEVISSKNDGQISHQMQDLRLKPHRFCSSENKIVRKPLSEATHLNQGSSTNDNPINNYDAQYQNIVKGNALTKENYSKDSKKISEDNVANIKMVQSLQECDKLHDVNQESLSTLSINDEKSVCQNSLEIGKTTPFISNEKRGYELVPGSRVAAIYDYNVIRDGCMKKQMPQHNSEGILNSKNSNLSTESRNGNTHSILPDANGQRINLPSPVNCESNPGNVQFSVVSKSDNKYGKIITVKGSDYLVLGKLGQGMSGEVLRVQEVKTGELRAVKCVDLSRIDKETAQGCLEEVSMLNKLRAPCIINMITYEIKSHMLYVVMEMGDTDLSKLLKSMSRDKQLPLTMILYYWTEMLTAVKYIHDNGVIHSDLKPANFLLVRGRLKLIDFGIASTINADMTSVVKNSSLGTLNYISPEAINDIGGNEDSPSDNNQYKINFKSDVWSLGCILYSLVYGQTPFQHIRANWAKVNAITNPNQKIAFPPPESTTRRGYIPPPPFLVDVMRRCLQHDRMARPSVNQLLQIPYVGCNCPPISSLPSIPPSILSKIKRSLEDNEWRQLLEALERRKPV